MIIVMPGESLLVKDEYEWYRNYNYIDLNLDLSSMAMTSDLTHAAMVGGGRVQEKEGVGQEDLRQPCVDGLASPLDSNAVIVVKKGTYAEILFTLACIATTWRDVYTKYLVR